MPESRADLTLKPTRRRLWYELLLDYLFPNHFPIPQSVKPSWMRPLRTCQNKFIWRNRKPETEQILRIPIYRPLAAAPTEQMEAAIRIR